MLLPNQLQNWMVAKPRVIAPKVPAGLFSLEARATRNRMDLMNAHAHFSLSLALDSLHHFEMPIYLPPPERGELRTLMDTAHYVLELPPHIFGKPLWQEAAKAVVGAARNELSLDIVWFAICRALLARKLD
jgi:hypothetical protein